LSTAILTTWGTRVSGTSQVVKNYCGFTLNFIFISTTYDVFVFVMSWVVITVLYYQSLCYCVDVVTCFKHRKKIRNSSEPSNRDVRLNRRSCHGIIRLLPVAANRYWNTTFLGLSCCCLVLTKKISTYAQTMLIIYSAEVRLSNSLF